MSYQQTPASLKAYTKATHTVAKTRQVVMLYDGAIRCIKQAEEAIGQKNIELRYHKLTRASEILNGLQNCLDFDSGGSTAQVLYDFYASIDMRILQLHRDPSVTECQQIVRELKEMRDVWDTIDRGKDGEPKTGASSVSDQETPPPAPAPSSVKVSA